MARETDLVTFVCFFTERQSYIPLQLLHILADLSLEAMASLLQLLNWAVLGEFIGSTSHLTLRQSAREQLLYADTQQATA